MGKYTSKKTTMSNYPERLADRGVSSSQVRMPFIDSRGRKYSSMTDLNRANGKRVILEDVL